MVTQKVNMRQLIEDNIYFVIFMLGLLITTLVMVAMVPRLPGIPELEHTAFLFGIAIETIMLQLLVAGLLLYRWNAKGRKNNVLLIWGLSFIAYTVPFIGRVLMAWGFSWANDSLSPLTFFIFRNPQILFAAGMYFGIAKIISKNKFLHYVPTAAILIGGYAWFVFGLLLVGDVELTMYGFLYGIFCPVLFTVAYSYYKYAVDFGLQFPRWLAFGFGWLGMIYLTWAPWHGNNVYLILWFFFVQSFVFIAMGLATMFVELNKGSKL